VGGGGTRCLGSPTQGGRTVESPRNKSRGKLRVKKEERRPFFLGGGLHSKDEEKADHIFREFRLFCKDRTGTGEFFSGVAVSASPKKERENEPILDRRRGGKNGGAPTLLHRTIEK